jgi:hypothetical protein
MAPVNPDSPKPPIKKGDKEVVKPKPKKNGKKN